MEKRKELSKDFNEDEMKKVFEEKYDMLCTINESFQEKIVKLFERNGINSSNFSRYTDLDRQFYYHFISKGYVPNMNTFVSMCMGLGLDLAMADSLLEALRHKFDRRNRVHCAYIFLLTNYQGLCIDDCNKILRGLGITDEKKELLGSSYYKKD